MARSARVGYVPAAIASLLVDTDCVLTPTGQARLERRTVGELAFPTGHVVVCDPVYSGFTQRFTRAVSPGNYPVALTIAHFPDEQRIACASVEFVSGSPCVWELATTVDRSKRKLKPTEYFGFLVDSGIGCFADERFAMELAGHLSADQEGAWTDLMSRMDENSTDSMGWGLIPLADTQAGGAILFDAGVGDGTYPCYFGMDGKGQVMCLVADFRLIFGADNPVEKPRWWHVLRSKPKPVKIVDSMSLPRPKGLCVRTNAPASCVYAPVQRFAGYQCHYCKPPSLGGQYGTGNIVAVSKTTHRQPHPPVTMLATRFGTMLQ